MSKEKLKSNHGVSMADVIIAMIILTMFASVIGSLYYQIILNSNIVKMNAKAVYYAIKVAEDIDKMPYEEVTNALNNVIGETYQLSDSYSILVQVDNYNEKDISKKDILKVVTIQVNYTCFNTTRNYQIEKLKVKEI